MSEGVIEGVVEGAFTSSMLVPDDAGGPGRRPMP